MRIGPCLAAALLCAGCQTPPAMTAADEEPPEDAAACTGIRGRKNADNCRIAVKVTESASGCSVDVQDAAQSDVVFESGRTNRWIVWQLDGTPPGYRFVKDGIAFKRGTDPLNNFRKAKVVGPRDQAFAVRNTNSTAWGVGDYPYSISVEHPAKGIRCELDPWIRNR